MNGAVLDGLLHAVWVFYAFGPQLVICLVLAYGAARRSHGSMINWLVAGFLAAIVPVFGVLAMAWLYARAKPTPTAGP